LLTLASEECNEIAKELLKCVRFTPFDSLDGIRNVDRVSNELADLMGVIELLREEGVDINPTRIAINDKKARLKHWMAVSDRLRDAASN